MVTGAAKPSPKADSSNKKLNLAMAILLGVLTILLVAVGTFGMYKYWQRRRREQHQARFLKLFEEGVAKPSPKADSSNKKLNLAMAILLGVLTILLVAVGTFGMYKYWQRRRREQHQARFLKLFEEGDDIEDELEF
ncbi:hypothetical protein HPP92_026989 [Vanilla planifolia]|uniref:Transmembrane protein n=1 Tax=Vanilla planifolia TaxID=51239 RepID=A0A835PDQ8_VANPL|nr:hypothetical protein HPP92_026989 [Vanilla planifolia]